jgi:hypothetical protein
MTAPNLSPIQSFLRHPAVRVAAWLLGCLLMIAAVWVALRDPALSEQTISHFHSGVARLGVTRILVLLCLPLLSLLLTTACFWHLMRAHGRVGFSEMWHLISASWFLNLLPMKPGLIGRVVYHSKINSIPASTSVRVLIEASAAGIIGVMLLSGLLVRARIGSIWFDSAIVLLWLGVLVLGLWGAVRPRHPLARLATAMLLRALDAFTWVLRYAILFAVMDVDLSIDSAAIIAAGAQAATYVPLVGNGLGVREWVVGGLSRWLQTGDAAGALAAGLSADLANRLVEMLVLGPVGLLGVWWVARRIRMKDGSGDHTGSSAAA